MSRKSFISNRSIALYGEYQNDLKTAIVITLTVISTKISTSPGKRKYFSTKNASKTMRTSLYFVIFILVI